MMSSVVKSRVPVWMRGILIAIFDRREEPGLIFGEAEPPMEPPYCSRSKGGVGKVVVECGRKRLQIAIAFKHECASHGTHWFRTA